MKQQSFSANSHTQMATTSLPQQQVSHFFSATPIEVARFLLHLFQKPQAVDACPDTLYQLVTADEATLKYMSYRDAIYDIDAICNIVTATQEPSLRRSAAQTASWNFILKPCQGLSSSHIKRQSHRPSLATDAIGLSITPLAMGSLLQVQSSAATHSTAAFIDVWTHQLVLWSALLPQHKQPHHNQTQSKLPPQNRPQPSYFSEPNPQSILAATDTLN